MTIITKLILTVIAGWVLLTGAVAAATLNVQIPAAPPSLDPQRMTGDKSDAILGDLFEGLVTEDAAGRPIPGQAESWSISADGLTYTFRLRDGLSWSDGVPLTAHDFVFAFRRLVDPRTASAFAYIQFPLKNAEAIATGKLADMAALGAAAADDRTLILRLERPTPFLLEALIQPTAYPLPRHVVEKIGADWASPQHLVGNGPYRLAEATPDLIRSRRNDAYYGHASVAIDEVRYHVLDEAAALMAYENGTIDIATQFPQGRNDHLDASHKGEARTAPAPGIWYLVLNPAKPPFGNAEVRRALSMALDRDALVAAVGLGEIPALGWVPPGIAGFEAQTYRPDWADVPLGERRQRARQALAQAGYDATRPLKLTLRSSNLDSQIRLGDVIANLWREIGVEVSLLRADIPAHLEARAKGDYDVATGRWVLDYSDAGDVLGLLASDHPNNYRSYADPALDALLKQAAVEADAARRRQMLRDAERMAMDDMAAIPLYWPVSRNLVSPAITGFIANVRDVHRARWLDKRD